MVVLHLNVGHPSGRRLSIQMSAIQRLAWTRSRSDYTRKPDTGFGGGR
jgi:hypothetical protein